MSDDRIKDAIQVGCSVAIAATTVYLVWHVINPNGVQQFKLAALAKAREIARAKEHKWHEIHTELSEAYLNAGLANR